MKRISVLLFSLTFVLISCKKDKKNNEPEPENPFDKKGLVVNMADNLILPSYQAFKTALDSLSAEYTVFAASPTEAQLQVVKQRYYASYFRYQQMSVFEFGPAESVIVRMNFNVFPTDTVQIKSNIASGSYALDAANNLDAKGFPALDYLFYGINKTETQIVQEFTGSANRKTYVTNLLSDMQSKINAIIAEWNSSYRNTFINSLSTDVGSSIGFLVNQLNFELDYIKNSKIGTPMGKKTLGIPVPGSCEAFYGGQSLALAKETLKSIENIYLGRSLSGANGLGFDDYLVHLKANHTSGSLNNAINAQFNVCRDKLNAIGNPLSQQVISNASVVDAAYVELVKLLVLLKTDMPSNLGVIITYQDGDGD
jgi:uncharacterized protein